MFDSPLLAASQQEDNVRWRSRLNSSTFVPFTKTILKSNLFPMKKILSFNWARALRFSARVCALISFALIRPVRADETCSSPYLARIEGQEDFVYVWTLGVEGLGDGADKLVVVDVKPGSTKYG